MRIIEEIKLDFSDVLIKPKRSQLKTRKEVELQREFNFKYSNYKWTGVPIIAANMDGVGTLSMYRELSEHKCLTALTKFHNGTFPMSDFYMITLGIDDDEKMTAYTNKNEFCPFKWICLDVANGYTERFVEYVEKIRNKFSNHIIVAGNVVTAEMTEQLILAGADVVKVGIGPGSVCTTRKMTGVGYPQLSAIMECADAAHGLGGHIVADGGCTVPGDVAKAFGAGADFVMLGGMLAGHDEGEGTIVSTAYLTNDFDVSDDTIWDDILNTGGTHNRYVRKKFVEFYGMSSKEAQDKHSGGMANYKASEGKVVRVPYRGSVKNTIEEIMGGLRSACTYAGARNLKSLPKCTTFVRVNRQLNEVFGKSV
jgi:GMP reductase